VVHEIVTWSVLAIGWLVLLIRNRPDEYQSYSEADRERRLGGSHQARMFDIALETGEVPHDANRETWRKELTGRNEWLTRVLTIATFCAVAWDMYQWVQRHTFHEIARVALIVAAVGCAIGLAFWLVPTPKADAAKAARKQLLAQIDEERTLLERDQAAYRVVSPVGSRRTLRRRGERRSVPVRP
jgi:hypothetical protein